MSNAQNQQMHSTNHEQVRICLSATMNNCIDRIEQLTVSKTANISAKKATGKNTTQLLKSAIDNLRTGTGCCTRSQLQHFFEGKKSTSPYSVFHIKKNKATPSAFSIKGSISRSSPTQCPTYLVRHHSPNSCILPRDINITDLPRQFLLR